jgi:uncharacterized membrane protein
VWDKVKYRRRVQKKIIVGVIVVRSAVVGLAVAWVEELVVGFVESFVVGFVEEFVGEKIESFVEIGITFAVVAGVTVVGLVVRVVGVPEAGIAGYCSCPPATYLGLFPA